MTDAQARCSVCNAVLPVARSSAIAWTSGLVVTGIGVAASKTWWGRLLSAGVGIATIALVEHLGRPVCGDCRVG